MATLRLSIYSAELPFNSGVITVFAAPHTSHAVMQLSFPKRSHLMKTNLKQHYQTQLAFLPFNCIHIPQLMPSNHSFLLLTLGKLYQDITKYVFVYGHYQ